MRVNFSGASRGFLRVPQTPQNKLTGAPATSRLLLRRRRQQHTVRCLTYGSRVTFPSKASRPPVRYPSVESVLVDGPLLGALSQPDHVPSSSRWRADSASIHTLIHAQTGQLQQSKAPDCPALGKRPITPGPGHRRPFHRTKAQHPPLKVVRLLPSHATASSRDGTAGTLSSATRPPLPPHSTMQAPQPSRFSSRAACLVRLRQAFHKHMAAPLLCAPSCGLSSHVSARRHMTACASFHACTRGTQGRPRFAFVASARGVARRLLFRAGGAARRTLGTRGSTARRCAPLWLSFPACRAAFPQRSAVEPDHTRAGQCRGQQRLRHVACNPA